MSRAMTKHGDYSVHIDWYEKKGAGGLYKQIRHRVGRVLVGELCKIGSVITYTHFVKDEQTIYQKDAWSLEMTLFAVLRCLGVRFIEIRTTNGDSWTIEFAKFDAEKRPGDQPHNRYRFVVKRESFDFEKGTPETIEQQMKIGKWK